MMKYKCFDCLSSTDQKVLRAAVDQNEDFDKIVKIADSLVSADTITIGMVGYSQDGSEDPGQWCCEFDEREPYECNRDTLGNEIESKPLPICWNYGEKGHRYWECHHSS